MPVPSSSSSYHHHHHHHHHHPSVCGSRCVDLFGWDASKTVGGHCADRISSRCVARWYDLFHAVSVSFCSLSLPPPVVLLDGWCVISLSVLNLPLSCCLCLFPSVSVAIAQIGPPPVVLLDGNYVLLLSSCFSSDSHLYSLFVCL